MTTDMAVGSEQPELLAVSLGLLAGGAVALALAGVLLAAGVRSRR